MKKQAISDAMLRSLSSGELRPLLEAVRKDDTLCLELRGDCVDICYRGGSLLRVTEHSRGFRINFDFNYCNGHLGELSGQPNIDQTVELLPIYKQTVDHWICRHPKYERELRQLIQRENSRSAGTRFGTTDYTIISMARAQRGIPFDMVGMKWPSSGVMRKDTARPTIALLAVRYEDTTLRGQAGIRKQLSDINAFLKKQGVLEEFCADLSQVLCQKYELGLIGALGEKQLQVSFRPEDVEVIFIFAGHNPGSRALAEEISGIKAGQYPFPTKAATASLMGYGLYADRMVDLSELAGSPP